ncbi:MAG: rhomboid family intramembrane serine protease [Planctomycetales bacterium]|nr:rhomboid family intramembrane serine protease [Planctomycetales bacterium]
MNLRSHGMSLYDRDYVRDTQQPQPLPTPKSAVAVLITINVIVFLLDQLAGPTGWLASYLVAFSTTIVQPWDWWRFVTYGFAHAPIGFGHIFGNMIGLFFFGRAIEGVLGPKRFVGFYLTAVVLGGLAFSVRHYLMGPRELPIPMLGASGAIFALVILFALKFPHNKIYLWFTVPVPAWLLASAYLLIELTALNRHDSVAHDVHIAGAIYGFVFFKTGWSFLSLAPSSLLDSFSGKSFSAMTTRRPKVKLYDPEARDSKLDKEADRILDKVHREGADSLTAKERRILEDYSRRMQQKRR